jgi:hypothetical protein
MFDPANLDASDNEPELVTTVLDDQIEFRAAVSCFPDRDTHEFRAIRQPVLDAGQAPITGVAIFKMPKGSSWPELLDHWTWTEPLAWL